MNLTLRFSAALATASFLIIGCGDSSRPSAQESAAKPKAPRIGVVLPTFKHAFYAAEKQTLEDQAKKLGVELDIRDGQDDPLRQIRQAESLIVSRVDFLIVCPADEDSLVAAVEAANRARIPAISLNRKVSGGKLVAYVGADDHAGGETQGKALVAALGPKGGMVLYLQGTLSPPRETKRYHGIQEALKGLYNIPLVDQRIDTTSPKKTRAALTKLILNYPKGKIRAIVAESDELSLQAAEIARAEGWNDVVVFGYNGTKAAFDAIKSGKMLATILDDPAEHCSAALQTAIDHLNGKSLTEDVFTPPRLDHQGQSRQTFTSLLEKYAHVLRKALRPMSEPAKLRWGILGCARITRRGLIPGLHAAKTATLTTLASRNISNAMSWAAEFGITKTYGSYEQVLSDPEIDVVYIPLPNELHREWVEAAADAGKHILCEKPLALDAAEAAAMVDYCNKKGVVLREAFMWRHQPRTLELLQKVADGAIGPLRLIRSAFSFNIDPTDWRLDATRGGGALWDVGCYGVSTARLFAGEEPSQIAATAHFGATGVDLSLAATLKFPSGVLAVIDCSFEQPFRCSYELVGETGRIDVPDAYLPPEYPIAHYHGPNGMETWTFPGTNQYAAMVDAFTDAVRKTNRQGYPAETGLAQMCTIDAIQAAARA